MYYLETMTYTKEGLETKRLPFADFGDLLDCYNSGAFQDIVRNPFNSELTIDNDPEEVVKEKGLAVIRQLVIRNDDRVKKYNIIWTGENVKIRLKEVMVVYKGLN